MKFGKRIRTELSAGLLRGSLDYKALKRIAKALRDSTEPTLQQLQHNGHKHRDLDAVTDFFFARLEAEKEKVSKFYSTREQWCFLALERTRGALFGLTRRASKGRLCSQEGSVAVARETAGELEGRFLEAKARVSVLLEESGHLVKFVDMNMHAFRKLLKKLDKWTEGDRGRAYFDVMVRTQPWISGGRAHGVLRMASAMADHLRSLRPALALGPAAGGPTWANRIVYSVGSFDRPRMYPEEISSFCEVEVSCSTLNTVCTRTADPFLSPAKTVDTTFTYGSGIARSTTAAGSGRAGAGVCAPSYSPTGQAAAVAEAVAAESTVEGSRLRFLREFGAVVVVGVYTDAAHAACHGGVKPVESLVDRIARVRPHADHVVAVDSPDSARVREMLLGASAAAASVASHTATGEGAGSDASAVWPTIRIAIGGDDCAGVAGGGVGTNGGGFSSVKDNNRRSRSIISNGGCRTESSFENGSKRLLAGGGSVSSAVGCIPGTIDSPTLPSACVGSSNCCFVMCDWEVQGTGHNEEGRRACRDTRAVMEQSMPVFRLPSPTWARGSSGRGEEEGVLRFW